MKNNIKKQLKDTKKIGTRYFKKPDETLLPFKPLYSGELIAQERMSMIVPSIDFLQQLAKQTENKIYVNKKTEWMFICARDIFGKGIIKHNNTKEKEIVYVMNEENECIGYGQVVAPLTQKGFAVKRIFDIGDLLRRER